LPRPRRRLGMSKKTYIEIILSVNPSESRIAVMEDKKLVELYVERSSQRRLVGNIYKARVNSVSPSLRAAFLNIGYSKAAFLPMADVSHEMLDYENTILAPEMAEEDSKGALKADLGRTLKAGQELLVQVAKEPMGNKGPRVTTFISIAGRYAVLMPSVNHIGISRRIADRKERERLRKIAISLQPRGCGLIVRTETARKSEQEIRSDMKHLLRVWNRIRATAEKKPAPALIHRDVSLVERLMRDIFSSDVDAFIVDTKEEYRKALLSAKSLPSDIRSRIRLYEKKTPIFDAYNVEPQIEQIFQRKISLRTGGYIVIDQTEAMVTIDVNSGSFAKESDPEKMILKTNIEAASEIARQLRLRDIGGIIVIDFIDMEEEVNRRKVTGELRRALKRDKTRAKVLRISELGLVEMTRKRVGPSLVQAFCDPCPTCNGTGRVLSKDSIAMRLERWLERAAEKLEGQHILIQVNPALASYLSLEWLDLFSKISHDRRIGIELKEDHNVRIDDFKVYLLETSSEITRDFGT
jgi:ribonuclease G